MVLVNYHFGLQIQKFSYQRISAKIYLFFAISVNLASQSRNYGTAFPGFATNTSSSQSLVEYLGLSDINDQKNTRSHAQVKNRTFQTGNGRHFANKNQTNNNQDIRQKQFNYYNTANYDKNSYSNRKY